MRKPRDLRTVDIDFLAFDVSLSTIFHRRVYCTCKLHIAAYGRFLDLNMQERRRMTYDTSGTKRDEEDDCRLGGWGRGVEGKEPGGKGEKRGNVFRVRATAYRFYTSRPCMCTRTR